GTHSSQCSRSATARNTRSGGKSTTPVPTPSRTPLAQGELRLANGVVRQGFDWLERERDVEPPLLHDTNP
ncbi:MAG TPA: hypothetical protein VGC93_05880, partial [Thermoanaerobaculia bacterium]